MANAPQRRRRSTENRARTSAKGLFAGRPAAAAIRAPISGFSAARAGVTPPDNIDSIARAILRRSGADSPAKAARCRDYACSVKAGRVKKAAGQGGYRRDHLRALAQRAEVADRDVRIMGTNGKPLRTLAAASSAKIGSRRGAQFYSELAEREGFEPPIQLPVCRISSAVLSTTQPPLRGATGVRRRLSGGGCLARGQITRAGAGDQASRPLSLARRAPRPRAASAALAKR